MKFYHGTSTEAFLKIKEEGFNCPATNWNCSDDTRVYLAGIDLDTKIATQAHSFRRGLVVQQYKLFNKLNYIFNFTMEIFTYAI